MSFEIGDKIKFKEAKCARITPAEKEWPMVYTVTHLSPEGEIKDFSTGGRWEPTKWAFGDYCFEKVEATPVTLTQLGKGSSYKVEMFGVVVIFSYTTPVMVEVGGEWYESKDKFSSTTSKHISSWKKKECITNELKKINVLEVLASIVV
jgi:hypothetical protein